MQESYDRVRKCAKVKGRVELKIDKPQSKRPLVTVSTNIHHSNPSSFPIPLELTATPCWPLHFANCSGAPVSYKLVKWLFSHGMNYSVCICTPRDYD